MAKAEQAKALTRCHSEGVEMRFYAMIMEFGSRRVHAWRGLSHQEV